jgi:hypothetical protein
VAELRQFPVMMSDRERADLKRAASKEKVSMGELSRRAIREYIKELARKAGK